MRTIFFMCTVFAASLCVSISAQEDGTSASKKAPSCSVKGEVNRPGDVLFPQARDLTIVDAISLAGGPSRNADLKRVLLIRANANGDAETTVIDVMPFWRDSTLKAPTIRGGDRIVVSGRVN